MKTIDLDQYRSDGVSVLAGRERGRFCRESAELDKLDSQSDSVEVLIPSDLIAITTSFFQAMFGDSIRKLGAKGFREKYIFKNAAEFEEEIACGVQDALTRQSGLRAFV